MWGVDERALSRVARLELEVLAAGGLAEAHADPGGLRALVGRERAVDLDRLPRAHAHPRLPSREPEGVLPPPGVAQLRESTAAHDELARPLAARRLDGVAQVGRCERGRDDEVLLRHASQLVARGEEHEADEHCEPPHDLSYGSATRVPSRRARVATRPQLGPGPQMTNLLGPGPQLTNLVGAGAPTDNLGWGRLTRSRRRGVAVMYNLPRSGR